MSPRAAALAEMQRATTADARAATPLPPDLEVSRPIVLPRSPSDLDELIGHRPSEAENTRPRAATPSRPVAAVQSATPPRGAERVTPRLRMAVPQDARRSASPHADAEVVRVTAPLHLTDSQAAIPEVVGHVPTAKVAPLAPMMLPVGRGPRWNPPTRWTRAKPRSRHLPQFIVLLMLAAFAFMCTQLGWIDLDKWRALLADYL
jgi:hypothetical protein